MHIDVWCMRHPLLQSNVSVASELSVQVSKLLAIFFFNDEFTAVRRYLIRRRYATFKCAPFQKLRAAHHIHPSVSMAHTFVSSASIRRRLTGSFKYKNTFRSLFKINMDYIDNTCRIIGYGQTFTMVYTKKNFYN